MDKNADIFAALFPEEETVGETMVQLIAALDKLTDAQRDLIYEHFGARKSSPDFARNLMCLCHAG